MCKLICDDLNKKRCNKEKIINFLKQNEISFNIINCSGCDKICIDLNIEDKNCKRYCCNSDIVILTSNKEACRVRLKEILYVAIENRKSVLYLTDEKIETNYQLDYWKNILDMRSFAQPHNSFIVNLNYVEKVTREYVLIKYKDKKYSVYTSIRKAAAFKKAFLSFNK